MNTKLFEKIFANIVAVALMCFALMPGDSAAIIARDDSLDYECKPRWDKFIVDENMTNWDRTAVDCFDRYGNKVDMAKLYGSPSVYGEYEAGYVDVPLLRTMYGNVAEPFPVRAAKPKAKPAQAKNNGAKKTASVAKPKVAPVSKPVKSAKSAVKPDLKPDPKPAADVAIKPAPVPDEQALGIARSLSEKIITAETYCDQINLPVKGPLPKGIVLMPGRPDLMSCVKN